MNETLRKTWELVFVDAAARRAGLVVLLGSVVAAVLEALGIGLVMPFVAVLESPARARSWPLISTAVAALDIRTDLGVAVLAGSALLGAFVLKNLYLTVFTYVQQRFVETRLVELTRRLMDAYLRQPYTAYLGRNSAQQIQNTVTEAPSVLTQVVNAAMTLAVEALSAGVMLIVVVALGPVALPVLALVVVGLAYAFVRTVYARAGAWGETKVSSHADMVKWVQQGLGGLKESRALGVERFFLDRFAAAAQSYAQAVRVHRVLGALPRYALELAGVVTLVALSLILIAGTDDVASILPFLGVLALAAVRLMPSAARMVASVGDIRHFGSSVDAVHADLFGAAMVDATNGAALPLPITRAVAVENLRVTYPGAAQPALDGVTLEVRAGESMALVGGSGAGKTTLADVLIGVLPPTEGSLRVDGHTLEGALVHRYRRSVGYVSQHTFLCDDTVRRNVAFGVADDAIDDRTVWRALEAAQLDEVVREMPSGLDTFVGERGVRLSGGQRQRIGIARALYRDPPLLVLDEATSALDGSTEREVVAAIERLRGTRTIVVIAHRLSTVRTCDRLALMDRGKIADVGTWDEVLRRNATFRELVRLGRLDGGEPQHDAPATQLESRDA